MDEYIDITPNRDGMIRWARMLLWQSDAGSKDAEVARAILREYGIFDAWADEITVAEFLEAHPFEPCFVASVGGNRCYTTDGERPGVFGGLV